MCWFLFYSALVYVAAGVTAGLYAFPPWEKGMTSIEDSTQNIYALTTTLFPPLWVPSFAIGTAAYFLFDSVRPYESGKWVRYAVVGDVLSVLFMVFHIAMYATVHWPYPDFTNDIKNIVAENQNSGLKRYMWNTIVMRLMSPFIAIWIILISMKGKSLTSRMLEWSPLAKVRRLVCVTTYTTPSSAKVQIWIQLIPHKGIYKMHLDFQKYRYKHLYLDYHVCRH